MTSIAWILVKVTLVLLAGLAASAAARKAPASVRHLVLASTFVALLILPLVAAVAPPNVVEVEALSSAINNVGESSRAGSTTPIRNALAPAGTGTVAAATPTAPRPMSGGA